MSVTKPAKPSPQVYAAIFPPLQELAREMGYNLLLHGSLNRDCDLVAVPWVDNPKAELHFIQSMHKLLSGGCHELKEQYLHCILPGGRSSYNIVMNIGELNKYGIWKSESECRWYLDISITPLPTAATNIAA